MLETFVADLFRLPFRGGAIDVVWTCHAVEPNGGREREAVRDLLRVARRRLILFEPSWEHNSPEGRERMARHGYIRGLPKAIEAEGGVIESSWAMQQSVNPMNPTHVYVIRPPARAGRDHDVWACPTSGMPMSRKGDCYWSDGSLLAYPIIGGIPILRAEAAVLAPALA